MKKSVNSNIYGYALDFTWGRYGDYLAGAHEALVCVVSERMLSDEACQAFQKSYERLGYGDSPCAFVVLTGVEESVLVEGNAAVLDDVNLFALVEGLDPLTVVAADARSIEILGRAYRTGFDVSGTAHLLGRQAVGFASFEKMLHSSDEKQRAWAALKRSSAVNNQE